MTSTIFKGDRLDVFLLNLVKREAVLLPLLLEITLEILASAIRPKKKKKNTYRLEEKTNKQKTNNKKILAQFVNIVLYCTKKLVPPQIYVKLSYLKTNSTSLLGESS